MSRVHSSLPVGVWAFIHTLDKKSRPHSTLGWCIDTGRKNIGSALISQLLTINKTNLYATERCYTCSIMVSCTCACLFGRGGFLYSLRKLSSLAMCLSPIPECRKHVLIPILFRQCDVPAFMQHIYYLDFPRYKDSTQCEKYFWQRLYKSLVYDGRRRS